MILNWSGETAECIDCVDIDYAIALLSEMKSNLDRMHVCATYTRHAIITTSANLCGDKHDYVCFKVLGIPIGESE